MLLMLQERAVEDKPVAHWRTIGPKFLCRQNYGGCGSAGSHPPCIYDSFSHRWNSSAVMMPSSHFFFCSLACSLQA